MGHTLLRTCVVTWMLLSGLYCYALAQCPSRKDLQKTLQRLSTEADPRGQAGILQNWLRQWEQCGYPTDSTYINGLLQLGLSYNSRDELVAAMQVVQRATQLCRKRRLDMSPDQPAKALYRLGMVLADQNQPAMETLKQAVQQGKGIHSADRWVGAAYVYLANAYFSAGDFQQAINSAESGEQVTKYTNDRSLMTKLLQEKAKALDILGRYDAARRVAERVVVLSEQDGFPTMIARAYRLLGVIAENQQQLRDALRYRQRAFDIARKSKDFSAPDYALSVGALYHRLHQYDQAITYFQYGLDSSTNAYAKAYSLTMLGQVYGQKKAYVKALTYYQRGLTVMPIGFKNSAITSLPDAQSIRQADQKDYLLTLIRNKADTWLEYAKATNNNRQRLQYALDTYKIADQMIDIMRWEHTGQQSKLYWRQTTRGMYEQAIETCYQLGNTQQAFRFMEKSRAVMLADKLNELGARQKLTKQQIEHEERLQDAVSDQQSTLAEANPDDSAAYNSSRMTLLARQDSLTDFLKRLEVSNPAYFRYKYDTTITALSDLRSHLTAKKASFVTYFVGDSALYVLGVTTDTTLLIRQPLRRYQKNMQAFMRLLANPDAMNRKQNRDRFLSLGNGLYNQLLASCKLPVGRVIVSPDGSFVPFEALSRKVTKPDYLINDYAFSYTYSARLLLRKNAAKPAKNTNHGFLGIAPVTFAPSLKQVMLPGSEEALTLIAGRFQSPTLLTHEAATRRAFLKKGTDASVIQLFTHATADSSDQEPMLFFADSTLKLSDLGDESLPYAQLVVLAACKTGIGAVQQGEGVFSLARGFAALGVPSVLTTLWSVQNQATYELTDLFYKYVDEGLPKDIALQRAKQDWLKEADQTNQLPNFWAGLIVVGDAEPLIQADYSLWVAVVILLTLTGLGAWFWRRQKRRPMSSVSFPHSV